MPQTSPFNWIIMFMMFLITMVMLMSKIFSTMGLWATKFSSSNNLINNHINNLILLW